MMAVKLLLPARRLLALLWGACVEPPRLISSYLVKMRLINLQSTWHPSLPPLSPSHLLQLNKLRHLSVILLSLLQLNSGPLTFGQLRLGRAPKLKTWSIS